MKSLKASNRIGGYWEDCKKARKEIQKMDLQKAHDYEEFFEGRISSILEGLKFSDKFVEQKSYKGMITRVSLFGFNHKPDMTIGSDGIAFEVKRVWGAKPLKEAFAQALFYRTHYRFVIIVLVDKTVKGQVFNLINTKGSPEAALIKDYEDLNIFIICKLGGGT